MKVSGTPVGLCIVRHKRLILFSLFGIGTIILVLWAMAWMKQLQRKSRIANSLVQISTGIQNQRETRQIKSRSHPLSGAMKWLEDGPKHASGRDSWRFSLLAFMESVAANDLATSWKDGRYAGYAHPAYCLTQHRNQDGYYTTNCLAIVGPGCLAGSKVSVYEKDAILVVAVGDTEIAWGMAGDLRLDARQPTEVGPWLMGGTNTSPETWRRPPVAG